MRGGRTQSQLWAFVYFAVRFCRSSSARARRPHGSQRPVFADGLTSARAQVEGLDEVLGIHSIKFSDVTRVVSDPDPAPRGTFGPGRMSQRRTRVVGKDPSAREEACYARVQDNLTVDDIGCIAPSCSRVVPAASRRGRP